MREGDNGKCGTLLFFSKGRPLVRVLYHVSGSDRSRAPAVVEGGGG